MGHSGDDYDDAVDLAGSAYERLQKVTPGHDLLKYVEVTPTKVKIVKDYTEEFLEKFPQTNPGNDFPGRIYMYIRYERALTAAAREAEAAEQQQ